MLIAIFVILFSGKTNTSDINEDFDSSGVDLAGQAVLSISGFCEENDDGNEKYEPGVVSYKKKITGQRSGWSKNYQTRDLYDNRKGKLKEYYCENGKLNWEYVECEDGYDKVKMNFINKVNGKVKSTYVYYCEEPTCEDSDGGVNKFVKGTTSGLFEDTEELTETTDECLYNTVVTEYACLNGKVYGQNLPCPNGCEAGACIEAECSSNEDCLGTEETYCNENGGEVCTLITNYDCVGSECVPVSDDTSCTPCPVGCEDNACVTSEELSVICGNSIVDEGEICDDGNSKFGDGCTPLCTSDEICEEGNPCPQQLLNNPKIIQGIEANPLTTPDNYQEILLEKINDLETDNTDHWSDHRSKDAMGLADEEQLRLYLQKVALMLYVEFNNLVPWSILDYNDEDLILLLLTIILLPIQLVDTTKQ